MGVIFAGSTESVSAEATGSLILPLLRSLLPWAEPAQLDLLHTLLRKTWHVVEYGVLAWLWFRALSSGAEHRPPRHVLAAFAISVAYAGLDELHQAWARARTGSAGDVLLDGAGAAAALSLLRFDRQAAVSRLTALLLWIAAAGGTLLLLVHLVAGVPARWLWASAPLAWLALWGWIRLQGRQNP
jgi:VanZ family protein